MVSSLKFGAGCGMIAGAVSLFTDWPWWKTPAVVVLVALGALLIISFLRDEEYL